MGRRSVQLLVLLTFVVAVTNCADPNTTVINTTANAVTSNDPAIIDNPVTLPPPDPSVTEFNYYVRDPVTGVACILANMSIFISARYESTNGDFKTAVIEIPPTAQVKGVCSDTDALMAVNWREDPTLEETLNEITFMFGSTDTTSYVKTIYYTQYLDNKTFPDAKDQGELFRSILNDVYIFPAFKNDGLYKCAHGTTVGSKLKIELIITNVALIAFNTEKSVATKTVEYCQSDNEPATTPLPAPDPSVTEFNYYVRDPETGVACILANMSISIKANYISTSYTTKHTTLKIPLTAEVRGHCSGRGMPTMELIWADDPTLTGTQNGIAFMFNSTNSTFFLQDIVLELYITEKDFPDVIQIHEGKRFRRELQSVNKFFASKDGGLHRCESETTMHTQDYEITITNVALIAFNTEKSVATKTAEYCNSGADVAQWSGYVLLTATILMFLKLGDQGI